MECSQFTGRILQICRGENVDPAVRTSYLRRWAEQGRITGWKPDSGTETGASAEAELSPLPGGVGSQIKAMLASLGFTPSKTCTCNKLANEMDELGPDACEARREEFIERLRGAYKETTITARLKAVGLSVANGLAFRINPLSPVESLFDEAVRRARRGDV